MTNFIEFVKPGLYVLCRGVPAAIWSDYTAAWLWIAMCICGNCELVLDRFLINRVGILF